MADQSADPFALWREWVNQSERQWNSFLNEAMATPEFSQFMGKGMDVFLNLQKQSNEAIGRALSAMNMPTRNDVLSLGDRLTAIEERLLAIESALTGRAAPTTAAAPVEAPITPKDAAPRPARTKKPASS